MSSITTFQDVMAKWGSYADFARDIGIKPSHAEVMKVRKSIPPSHWPKIVKAAERRGCSEITYELLAKIAARASAGRSRQTAKAS